MIYDHGGQATTHNVMANTANWC